LIWRGSVSNEVEGKTRHRAEISERFAVLKNSDDDVDNIRAWETVRKIIEV
jgi:hypothetical protein